MSRSSICFALVFFAAFSVSFRSAAQNSTSSPYSRYGIGDITNKAFARQIGMGGAQLTFDGLYSVNSENPAAFGNLLLTTFEGAVNFVQYDFRTANDKYLTNTASLSYFDFAFPVKPGKWGLGFGLSPYSEVGYDVFESRINVLGDREERTYVGSGGINSFHIGTGFKIGKHLTAGFSGAYLFGAIDRDRTVEFNNTNYINSSISESVSVGWFHFNSGIQLTYDSLKVAPSDSVKLMDKKINSLSDSLERSLEKKDANYELKNALRQQIAEAKLIRKNILYSKVKSDWKVIGALTFSPQADLRARATYLNTSFRYSPASTPSAPIILTRDTIDSFDGQRSAIRIPVSVGAGFGLRKGTRWFIAADARFTQWSQFTYLGASGELENSMRGNLGIQFVPNERAIKSYLKTVYYRAGFFYEQSYLKLNGMRLNDMGVTAGITLPIRRSGTQLHFSAEAGRRGTTDKNLIEENYLRFTFGFTINDRWFLKPKYD